MATHQNKFEHKKSLGQHFLNSTVVPKWMCDAGKVENGDVVLEIGPGTGALTKELLARGAKVRAIETDARAIEALHDTFEAELNSGQLKILEGDLRELGIETVVSTFELRDHSFKLVANIPYYLSGYLFRMFLESTIQPSSIVFLVQKEVAARIARDKKESLLSLSIKAFGVPTYIRTVGKGHFVPQPAIDSAIILIADIGRGRFLDIQQEEFFNVLHLGFRQKRKQLAGNLSSHYSKEDIAEAFNQLSLENKVRAEDISIEKWVSLTTLLVKR